MCLTILGHYVLKDYDSCNTIPLETTTSYLPTFPFLIVVLAENKNTFSLILVVF